MKHSNIPSLKSVTAAVVASLTSDLLKPRYRKIASTQHKTFGHCYAASEALWYLLGGKSSGYQPQVLRVQGGTHWFLKHKLSGKVLDPTAKQFLEPINYAAAIRCPFLTGKPSSRAAIIMARAAERFSQRRCTNSDTPILPRIKTEDYWS